MLQKTLPPPTVSPRRRRRWCRVAAIGPDEFEREFIESSAEMPVEPELPRCCGQSGPVVVRSPPPGCPAREELALPRARRARPLLSEPSHPLVQLPLPGQPPRPACSVEPSAAHEDYVVLRIVTQRARPGLRGSGAGVFMSCQDFVAKEYIHGPPGLGLFSGLVPNMKTTSLAES